MKHSQLIESLVEKVRGLDPERDVSLLEGLEKMLLWKSNNAEKPELVVEYIMYDNRWYMLLTKRAPKKGLK